MKRWMLCLMAVLFVCQSPDAALCLDAQLIGLHLPQGTWLFDQGFMHGLPLASGAGSPRGDRPLINPKRRHKRWYGTPMGEQGHDEHHRLCRGAQPIEDRPCRVTEGFVTRLIDTPLFLPRVDTAIALASEASGRALPIGAQCGCGVHASPPDFVWKQAKRSMLDPHFCYK